MMGGEVLELCQFGFLLDFVRVQWGPEWNRLVFFWFFVFFLVRVQETEGNWVLRG